MGDVFLPFLKESALTEDWKVAIFPFFEDPHFFPTHFLPSVSPLLAVVHPVYHCFTVRRHGLCRRDTCAITRHPLRCGNGRHKRRNILTTTCRQRCFLPFSRFAPCPASYPLLLLTGDGIWCYGKVNHVYAGSRRGVGQSYRVKWDDGTSMKVPEVPWLCWVSCAVAFRPLISFLVLLECARRSRRCNRA
jgi:hypothetical protein